MLTPREHAPCDPRRRRIGVCSLGEQLANSITLRRHVQLSENRQRCSQLCGTVQFLLPLQRAPLPVTLGKSRAVVERLADRLILLEEGHGLLQSSPVLENQRLIAIGSRQPCAIVAFLADHLCLIEQYHRLFQSAPPA